MLPTLRLVPLMVATVLMTAGCSDRPAESAGADAPTPESAPAADPQGGAEAPAAGPNPAAGEAPPSTASPNALPSFEPGQEAPPRTDYITYAQGAWLVSTSFSGAEAGPSRSPCPSAAPSRWSTT